MSRGASATQITMWLDCPYKLKLTYLDKCKPIMFDPKVFNVGSAVHNAHEDYHLNNYSMQPSYDYVYYYMYQHLAGNWPKDETVENFIKANQCIQNLAKYEVDRTRTTPFKPLVELKLDTAGYFGYIDEYVAEILYGMDIKTPKSPSISKGAKVQSIVYKEMIEESFNVELESFWFYFPYPDIIRELKYSDKKIEPLFDEVHNARDNIKKAFKKFQFEKKPRTPKMCNSCDLRYYCIDLKM